MPPRYGHSQYRVSFGGPITPVVRALIIINVAVFVLEAVVYREAAGDAWETFLGLLALDPIKVFRPPFYVWQLVTYMFLHSASAIFHILFNMLVLWMFGCEIERLWGGPRFLRYYLLCGVGAGIATCAFAFFQPPVVGSSGAIFGLITAYAILFPTRTILFWGIFPMTTRQFALLLGGIELASVLVMSPDGVARFAHLGGALTGWLLLKGTWNPRRLIHDLRWRIRRRRFKALTGDRSDRDRFYPYH